MLLDPFDFLSSSSSNSFFRLTVEMRTLSVIGAITVPILVKTFGAASLRTADSGMNVDVTGALIVDSNAAADRNGKGKSFTCNKHD